MTEFIVDCQECDEEFNADNEEAAVGWIFGHGLRTEHIDIEKEPVE